MSIKAVDRDLTSVKKSLRMGQLSVQLSDKALGKVEMPFISLAEVLDSNLVQPVVTETESLKENAGRSQLRTANAITHLHSVAAGGGAIPLVEEAIQASQHADTLLTNNLPRLMANLETNLTALQEQLELIKDQAESLVEHTNNTRIELQLVGTEKTGMSGMIGATQTALSDYRRTLKT
jgi:hypothetical protein